MAGEHGPPAGGPRGQVGNCLSSDSHWQDEFEAAFPYTETADQLTGIAAIKTDMQTPRPMDRLICGDVGYGKTELAMAGSLQGDRLGAAGGVPRPHDRSSRDASSTRHRNGMPVGHPCFASRRDRRFGCWRRRGNTPTCRPESIALKAARIAARFAVPHVAADQPVHGTGGLHVGFDGGNPRELIRRFRVRKRRFESSCSDCREERQFRLGARAGLQVDHVAAMSATAFATDCLRFSNCSSRSSTASATTCFRRRTSAPGE